MVQMALLVITFLMGFVLCAVFVVGRSADLALADPSDRSAAGARTSGAARGVQTDQTLR